VGEADALAQAPRQLGRGKPLSPHQPGEIAGADENERFASHRELFNDIEIGRDQIVDRNPSQSLARDNAVEPRFRVLLDCAPIPIFRRIEIADPAIPEGSRATVRVTLEDEPSARSFRENLGDYKGRQLFTSGEEVEACLRAERDSWE